MRKLGTPNSFVVSGSAVFQVVHLMMASRVDKEVVQMSALELY